MRALTAIAALVVIAAAAGPAHAFKDAREFDDPAWVGGADGRTFTGVRRERGYSCAVCHVPAADPPVFVVRSEPAALLAEGEYEPGRRYVLSVELYRERVPAIPDADVTTTRGNSFDAEVVQADNEAAGTLDACAVRAAEGCAASETVKTIRDGRAVHGIAAQPDPADPIIFDERRTWSFAWTAPAAGSGDLALALAGVDGNSDGTNEGDAVAVARLPLRESAPNAGAAGWLVGLLPALAARRSRRRS